MSAVAVEVVLALPERQWRLSLSLPRGTGAREAVRRAVAAGLDVAAAGLDPETVAIGVYGEVVDDARALEEGDRVELYRPLALDPKERRRRQAAAAARERSRDATR